MEKSSAAKIVSQTFRNPFDKESFVYFIKSLLNHIEPAPFVYRGNIIPDAYKSYIKTLERIGKYQDKDDKKIDLLIVHLKKEKSLERARTMQRNFIAWYLNGSRGDILKDATLVAFVSPNSDDWRFSLVKMDYRLDASGEKVKVKQELTPARRFSFLVGKTESSHTAQSRLAPILQDDDSDPTLKDLEDAFSIEKVTKEFFEKYRDLFLRVKEALDEVVKKDKRVGQDFKEKNIDTVNFAKKLLGQVVFLYFLQKKGWFGVERDEGWGTGPKNFLRQLFDKRYGNYQNFFNDILEPLFYEALAIERTDDFYSRFNCKIPFLNGGLFDPINNYDWIHTDILLSNELFSNNTKTKEGDIGTGILDIFDRYNFTVKEDEPLEKEVAVDPEMLGKVFENLLEVKDRKSKGTYYTPREIVHYMCQQSLINYLKTETKIEEEKIERIVKQDVLLTKDEYLKWKKEKQKPKNKALALWEGEWEVLDKALENIRIVDPACGSGAFLVGMLQEIIKARKLLQLFNNQKESIYTIKEKSIKNSIYGVDIDPGAIEIAKLRLWLSLIVDEEDIKQIKPLPNLDYKIVCGNSLLGVEKNLFNQKLFSELEELKPLFFNETNSRKKQEYKRQIDELIGKITNGHKDFDFEIYFSEVFHEKKGFDVVIANPPYGEIIKDNKDYFKNNYQCAEGKYEIYKFFIEKGLKLLNNFGTLSFITSNTWLRLNYFKKLRELIFKNYHLYKISQSLHKVFENVTVDTIIFLISINRKKEHTLIVDENLLTEKKKKDIFNSNEFIINLNQKNSVIDKLDSINCTLLSVCEVTQGLIAYFSKNQEKIWTSDKKETKFHRKILYGGDIGKYFTKWSGEYLKYGEWLHRKRPSYVFDNDKLLVQRIRNPKLAERIIATFDNQKYINTNGLSNILILNKPKFVVDLKYILVLLNSKLINFWFSYHYNDVNIKPAQLRKIPIFKISSKEQKAFIEIVDQILEKKKNNPEADTGDLESEIDEMVYGLYGLGKEEIKIVEQSF